jgi:hypothetical protein
MYMAMDKQKRNLVNGVSNYAVTATPMLIAAIPIPCLSSAELFLKPYICIYDGSPLTETKEKRYIPNHHPWVNPQKLLRMYLNI